MAARGWSFINWIRNLRRYAPHPQAADPSGFKPNRRNRSASWPGLLSQQSGQPCSGIPVARVGPGAQLVQVAAVGQQPGQPLGGIPVAGVSPGA